MKTNKIKVNFLVPNKDYNNLESKELTVNITPYNKGTNSDPIYTVNIPKNIYDFLVNTEKKYFTRKKVKEVENKLLKERGIRNNDFTGYKPFTKTISSNLISVLREEISKLSSEVIFLKNKKNLQKTKKIFIQFNSGVSHTRNNMNAAYTGKIVTSSFRFFIGYEVYEPKHNIVLPGEEKEYVNNYYTYIQYHPKGSTTNHRDTNFNEGEELKKLNTDNAVFEKAFDIIDWTEEREAFLNTIQSKLESVNDKLNEFLSNITNNKIEELMKSSNIKKLL